MRAEPVDLLGSAPFDVGTALERGVSAKKLRNLLLLGQIRRVLRGVYVVATVPDDLDLRAAAASLVAPSGTVVCGRTAAWMFGVDALAMGAHRSLPDVDLMVPAGQSAARRTGVFGSSGPLGDDDIVVVGGVPVTAPARTAADLGRLLRRPDALASVDAMLRLRVTGIRQVRDVLGRFAGYRGVRQARELVAMATPLAESPQESRTRLRCVDAGFPAPEPQIKVYRANGSLLARLDMGWRSAQKALEYDGDEHHSTPDDQARDRGRREDVERLGWGLMVVTSYHVLSRRLEFENGVSELLGHPYELSRHHPSRGGWDAGGGAGRAA